MIGRTIGHYRILEKLGEGGMGIVYKAEDLQLKRTVALKFLPKRLSVHGEERERFMLEAQSASALNHPNICTVYAIGEEAGETFIAMEYLDGVTLRQWIRDQAGHSEGYRKLGVKDAVDLAVQIAEGLGKAHERGIIHRDIKSENIMVTTDGRAKIMDFGLAKLGSISKLTKTGSTIGTIAYMSPEQVEGLDVDYRTDIFSFGVLLYETLTGQLPFLAEHDTAVMYEIINVEPKAITELRHGLDQELNRIVMKCLEKDREIRYQSMKEVVVDLQRYRRDSSGRRIDTSTVTRAAAVREAKAPRRTPWAKLAAAGAALLVLAAAAWYFFALREAPIDSLAVLPFVNGTTDPNADYLAEGLTENIINKLSQLSQLRVIPRSLVARYKDKDTDPREVGKDLNVGAVLTGKVVQRGDALSIQAELIDVNNVSQLWGEQYSRTLSDIMSVQQDIAENVAEKLRTEISREERTGLAARHTANPEAYQLYLKGRFHWNKRTDEGSSKALEYFNASIERDPAFALGYAGIADCYAVSGISAHSPREHYARLRAAAMKALELDESLPEAHASLGIEKAYHEYDVAAGEKELRRSIELNPNYPTAHHWLAELLVFLGRFEEGFAEYRRASELDPLSLAISSDFGLAYAFARQYDRSIELLRKTIDMDPNFVRAHFYLMAPYYHKGMHDAAFEELVKGMTAAGETPQAIDRVRGIYASSGFKGLAKYEVDLALKNPASGLSSNLVRNYVILGRHEDALSRLEKLYEEGENSLVTIKVDPDLDPLRSNPRFIALMKKLGYDK